MAYALITGASSDIGREMAALFAADRHDLIITARSQGKLDDVKRTLEHRYGVHVETVALDLSESDAPQQLHDYTVSQGFEVDHLVNNAGFADWTGFLDARPLGAVGLCADGAEVAAHADEGALQAPGLSSLRHQLHGVALAHTAHVEIGRAHV